MKDPDAMRLIKFRTELKIAAAKKRIEARDLDNRCPECELNYDDCDCNHEKETS